MNASSRILPAVATAVLALSLAACERQPLEAASRDLGNFEAIELRGAAEIRVDVGADPTFKVEGTSYAVKNLHTEVRDNVLSIEAKKSGWAWFGDQDELRLTITMPRLTSLQSSGAGNIEVSGLKGGDQTIRIAGAHNLEAHGTLDRVTIELNGAGNIDYSDVSSREAQVTVNGAGHVIVQPSDLLDATVNGVGAIHYKGEPQKVRSQIHGIGTISRR